MIASGFKIQSGSVWIWIYFNIIIISEISTYTIALKCSGAVTSKIELVQQRINLARTLAGSQYAAISNAIEHATDLTSQFGQGIDTISDVNFSMETAHLAKDRIQQDAAAAILAQANKAQEGLMMLV